ncbi:hypothetical protein [Mycolicibacterium fluoranthenivorans]|uniref:Uncharacterized protein n=1 Tax=Mycolicibacterium fluoranthenivorans TaxID=258505 RepID=A0A1G4W2E6_9MYCO|nr:hypothetical protein [Mycolicibacterium fluoranthenivorans]SCX15203.1 hypothetical protein SAMN02799620_02016 [Mycolicibacterium fluoranthenivorans]
MAQSSKDPKPKPDRWDSHPRMVERVPASTGPSWLQSIRDTGAGSVVRGSSRWIAGLAILGTAGGLVLSPYLEWGRATTYDFTATMSGIGSVSVQLKGSPRASDTIIGSTAVGVPAVFLGLVALVAGGAFLWTAWRTASALVSAIAGGLAFVLCLVNAINIAGIMKPMTGPADFQVGVGLVLACVLAFALTALGVTAFVLERISMASPPAAGDHDGPKQGHAS